MTIDRKNFVKKLCLSGACLCGFSSIALSNVVGNEDGLTEPAKDKDLLLVKEWVASLLLNLNADIDKQVVRKLIKKTAVVHYNDLKMDELLEKYKGNLENFLIFLKDEWHWKIDYDKDNRILIADENKSNCVCPIADFTEAKDSSAICYCSEGFAEKMFSKVTRSAARAEVISSIRRGDASCKYKITF